MSLATRYLSSNQIDAAGEKFPAPRSFLLEM